MGAPVQVNMPRARMALAGVACIATLLLLGSSPSGDSSSAAGSSSVAGPRKIFLNMGGNVGYTEDYFLALYPDAHEYEFYTWEVDSDICNYLRSFGHHFKKHTLYCPRAVVGDPGATSITIKKYQSGFSQGVGGGRGKFWQGGLIEGVNNEEISGETVKVETTYVTDWMRKNLRKEDYVILKIDVEGEEYPILDDLLKYPEVVELVDKFYGEYHSWSRGKYQNKAIMEEIRARAAKLLPPHVVWAGDEQASADTGAFFKNQFKGMDVYTAAERSANPKAITFSVVVDHNDYWADLVLERIYLQYPDLASEIQVFVSGAFVRGFPGLVRKWQDRGFIIGALGDTAWGDYSSHFAGDKRGDLVRATNDFVRAGVFTNAFVPNDVTMRSAISPAITNTLTLAGKLYYVSALGDSWATVPPVYVAGQQWADDFYKWRSIERRFKTMDYLQAKLNSGVRDVFVLSDWRDTADTIIDQLKMIEGLGHEIVPAFTRK